MGDLGRIAPIVNKPICDTVALSENYIVSDEEEK